MEQWWGCVATIVIGRADNAHDCGVVYDDVSREHYYEVCTAHRNGWSEVSASCVVLSTSPTRLLVPASVVLHGNGLPSLTSLTSLTSLGAFQATVGRVLGGRAVFSKVHATVVRVITRPSPPGAFGWHLPSLPSRDIYRPWTALWQRWGVSSDVPAAPRPTPPGVWTVLELSEEGSAVPWVSFAAAQSHSAVQLGWPYASATHLLGLTASPVGDEEGEVDGAVRVASEHIPGLEGGLLVSCGRLCVTIAPRLGRKGETLALPLEPSTTVPRGVRSPTVWEVTGAKDKVVAVRCSDGRWGSAVSLGGGRYLTNAHVVSGDRRVTVGGQQGTVEHVSKAYDVAVVGGGPIRPPVVFAHKTKPLDPVAVVGYSSGPYVATVSTGAVIGCTMEYCTLVSAKVVPGASGGGLFDTEGRLVGLVTSCVMDTTLGHIVPSLGMCFPTALLRPYTTTPITEPKPLPALEREWQLASDTIASLNRLFRQFKAIGEEGASDADPDPDSAGSGLLAYVRSFQRANL